MKILEDLEDHMASRRIKNHELSLVENHVSGGECFPNGTPHTNMCKKKTFALSANSQTANTNGNVSGTIVKTSCWGYF
jgi:hypothetical protein